MVIAYHSKSSWSPLTAVSSRVMLPLTVFCFTILPWLSVAVLVSSFTFAHVSFDQLLRAGHPSPYFSCRYGPAPSLQKYFYAYEWSRGTRTRKLKPSFRSPSVVAVQRFVPRGFSHPLLH